MNVTFTVRLSMQDGAVMFTAAKDPPRSWNGHFLYLIALMRATDAFPAMVLQNIVRHASPGFSLTLLGRYNEQRPDHMLHAQELMQFARRYDARVVDRKTADKDVVSTVTLVNATTAIRSVISHVRVRPQSAPAMATNRKRRVQTGRSQPLVHSAERAGL
jgi:hypothetical protein